MSTAELLILENQVVMMKALRNMTTPVGSVWLELQRAIQKTESELNQHYYRGDVPNE